MALSIRCMPSSVEIFFSYAHGDEKETGESREKMIHEIYNSLLNDGYHVVRDKYDLGYTGQITKFMNRIGEGHLVIVGISDKYLKSEYCMYELLEIFRNSKGQEEDFTKRIIPLRVEDNLSLKTPEGKQVYIDHWNKRIDEAEASVKNNPDSIGPKRIEWLKRYREIKNELDDMLELFSDINTLTKELLSANNFAVIKSTILKRIQEEELKLGLQQHAVANKEVLLQQAFNENELFEISRVDSDAVVISVKQGKYVYFRSPNDVDFRVKYTVSGERFSEQVTGILQRLLVEDNLREDEFEILGTSLFQRLLCSSEAQVAFTTYVQQAVKNKIRLKIILRFDEESSLLACLPWEYLYCPFADNKGLFVGESNELILTRRLSVKGNDQLINTQELRVLIAVSDHLRKNDELKADEQILLEAIQDIQGYSGKKVSGQLEYFSSLNQLADFIVKQNTPFQVVHVFGMARSNKEATPTFELALGDTFSIQSNNLNWKNGQSFIDCFLQKPALIFLHAAVDSPEETYLALSGFAFQLLKEVPGVLALQAPAGNTNAINFSRYFYKALIQDETDMDTAVKRSLGEISFFKSKQPRVKVSSYLGKSFRFVFEKEAPAIKEQMVFAVKCKNKNDFASRKGEVCNNEIEFVKVEEATKVNYLLLEPDMKSCRRCGNILKRCHHCGYLIPSPEDNFCSACTTPVFRREELQQEGMFDGSKRTGSETLLFKNTR